jgi:alpha-glucosidase
MYIEGCRDGRFCKHPDGSVYHGKVWPGISAYPDFSRASTREWWARSHESLLGRGVSGIWCDMNEPSDFSRGGEASADRSLATVPDDLVSSEDGSPRPFALTHNAYGLDMSRAARRAFELLRPGERPFVLTRSGSAGIQRYAAVWTGDNHSWWEHLAQSVPMLLGMGLSGLPFVGADAGGFQGEADGELYVRWMELAALTPFFRAHSALGTRDKEPWSFGPEAEALARKAIRLRYSLLPYIYGEFRRASVEGLPIMRPLVLDCQDDPRARSLCDEYLLGPSLLVAPVLRPGDRERLVYLPKGTWYDFRSGEALEGGRSIIAAAPLGGIPLYAKAGAVIPTAESAASTAAMDLARLTLRAYAGAEGRYELYEDDGSSLGYERGEYSITECRVSKTESGRWSFAWEKLCDHWRGACRSPMIELVGGPWEEAGER